jgi:TonB family protein
MRDELHLMELVDRYLEGSMNEADRAAFEARANANAELRQLIEDQRALREGIARVPVRAAAAKAYRAYRFGKPGPWIGGAVLVAVITGASLFWANRPVEQARHESPFMETGVAPDEGEVAVLDDTTGTRLRPMVLSINPGTDTTLLTPNGMVIDIPRGAFLDAQGRTITDAVRVTVLEALDAVSIIKAGLSTMSGDTLLETGGMFYLDACRDGAPVAIDPTKPITVMVPSEKADPRMMLYQGVRTTEGLIDWRDPQPLKRSLVPVDITTLDFYPPGYLKKLAELRQDAGNRAFRDSLYWSFSALPSRMQKELAALFLGDSVDTDTSMNSVFPINGWGIDPAKVKTILQPRFNGTNLATREFEERMRAIHGTCDNGVLDLYAQGLDKDLSELDARAARMGHRAFDTFGKRNDGRVDLPKHAADRLRRMYEQWSRAEADAIRKTQEAFWAEQAKLDGVADMKRVQHSAQTEARRQELFQREYDANLADACRQLGIEKLGPRREPPITAYVANITNPGWWNVDRAVFQATADRKSMRFTDNQSGKSATLTYAPLVIEVNDRASYDELFVYLIPQELNSFQRMNERNGSFEERLNALFTYDLLCLGMKGKQQFAFTAMASGQSRITASLSPTDDNGLRKMLRAKGNVEERLLDESRYLYQSANDRARRKTNADRARLRQDLMPVVFPCAAQSEAAAAELIESSWADIPARFPNGEDALWQWLRARMKVPLTPGGDGRVLVRFTVEVDGRTTNHVIERSGGTACDEEALRVVRQMPRWEPSRTSNGPVACSMQLPINFSLE